MEMYIGANIKKLRQDRNITQEKLAEHLGVSTQAVSKWERHETYPDITMVLPLASYFKVSTDVILGLDEARNEEKIKHYLTESRKLFALGESVKRFKLINEAYKQFPNDYYIMEEYMQQLFYDPNTTEEPLTAHREELRKLAERIINECTIDKLRYSALDILSAVYVSEGRRDKAIEIANRLTEYYIDTKNEVLERIHNRNKDEWFPFLQQNLQDLLELAHYKIRNCAIHSDADSKTKIRILQKCIDLIRLIYDEGDFGFANSQLATVYVWIGCRYIDLQDYATAFGYMDKVLEYAKIYDELPVHVQHTSFLVNHLVFDKRDTSSMQPDNTVACILKDIERWYGNTNIAEMEEFKALIEKYKPFASASKENQCMF